jgi:hypothetical protein
MNRSQATIADARELQTQLCAYNSAFEELDLMFRWDVETLQSLAHAASDQARIAQYIEAHSAPQPSPGPTTPAVHGCGGRSATVRTHTPLEA